jgi:hypothetical protein
MFAVGPLVPDALRREPTLIAGAHLYEVHEFLSVSIPDVGPCRVDVAWDPPLVLAGLAGLTTWDGRTDMPLAIGPTTEMWAPDPAHLRAEKEQLRRRLYTAPERHLRDTTLAAMSRIFHCARRNCPISFDTGRDSVRRPGEWLGPATSVVRFR